MRSFKPDEAAGATRDLAAQKSREQNPPQVLLAAMRQSTTAMGMLNLYCKKPKVELQEELRLVDSEFRCKLTYEPVLRSHEAAGSSGQFFRAADSKKQAKRNAAIALLEAHMK